MIRRTTFALAAALLFAPFAPAQISNWKPDTAHSGIDFSLLHLGISKVRGHFAVAGGEVTFDEKDITKSKVNITINTASVDTQNSMRDDDLKSEKFFDTAKFPTGTFTSTSIKKTKDGLAINGNLTVHGITKPVVLTVDGPNGPVTGLDKKQHIGFSATTTVDRIAFGLAPSYPASVIGNDVKLTIDLDLAKQ
ncbi:YceI family protein [Terriglobus sp. RCC_193]|uniref:YceI family protein n=1 Tax=Terriglobus sp. RCC_193 TaxID=3239218 RepID=UPI0035252B8E